jgi:4-carboxymuconolactone decarboxylase
MTSLNDRYENGQAMRAQMAAGDPHHFSVPGIDQYAPDLRRIIDECLFGAIWTRPVLSLEKRAICTIAGLTALGQLPLLRRHVERGLNLGLTPHQVVEVFIQLTFYIGVPAVESAIRITKEIFEERGIEFIPTEVYDSTQSIEDLHELGHRTRDVMLGTPALPIPPDSEELELDRLILEYHWGAINTRPHLDVKDRAICALSAMTVLGQYDRQIRTRIQGALGVGMTPAEIMEVFIQVMLYGGFLTTRSAMRIARSVFTEQGISA